MPEMLGKVLSIAVPVLSWMGLIQGGRRHEGLDHWDGTLASLVVPPQLLRDYRVVQVEPPPPVFDSGFDLPLENASDFSDTMPASRAQILPYVAYLGIFTCIALAVIFRRRLIRFSTILKTRFGLLKLDNTPHASQLTAESKNNYFDALVGQKDFTRWTIQVKDLEIESQTASKKGLQAFLDWTIQVKDLEIERQRQKKEELQSVLGEKEQEVIDLRARKTEEETVLRDRVEELTALRNDKATLSLELSGKNNLNKIIASKARKMVRERDEEIEVLKKGKKQAKENLQERDSTIEALEEAKAKAEEDNVENDLKMEGLEREKTTLEEMVERMRGDKDDLRLRLREAKEMVRTLNEEKKVSKEEKKVLKGDRTALERNVEGLQREKSNLQSSLQEKESNIRTLAEQQTALKRNVDDLKGELNNVSSSLHKKESIIRTLDKEKAVFKRRADNLTEKNIDLQMDLYDEKNTMKTLNKEKTDSKENFDYLKRERSNLKSSLQENDRTIGTLKRENATLKEGAQTKVQRIETLEIEYQGLKQEGQWKDQTIDELSSQLSSAQARSRELEGIVKTRQQGLDGQKTVVIADRSQGGGKPTGPTPGGSQKPIGDGKESGKSLKGSDSSTASTPGPSKKPTSDSKESGKSLKGSDVHDTTSVAGGAAKKNTAPARPPTSEHKATPVSHPRPSKPTFTGASTPSQSDRTSRFSQSSSSDFVAGSDSRVNEGKQPKVSVPPWLPHHQSISAGSSSSQSTSGQPSPLIPAPRGTNVPLTGAKQVPSGQPSSTFPGLLGTNAPSKATTQGPSSQPPSIFPGLLGANAAFTGTTPSQSPFNSGSVKPSSGPKYPFEEQGTPQPSATKAPFSQRGNNKNNNNNNNNGPNTSSIFNKPSRPTAPPKNVKAGPSPLFSEDAFQQFNAS